LAGVGRSFDGIVRFASIKVSLSELREIWYKTGMLPQKREFLIQGEDGTEYGPAGLEELRDWVRENRAGLGSFVRLDEPGAIWEPWQHYPELVALLAEAKATSRGAGLTIAPLGRRVLAGIADVVLGYILALPIIFVVFVISLITVPDLPGQMIQFYLHPQNPVPEPLVIYLVEVSNLIYCGVLTLYMAGFQAAHGRTPAKALMHLRVAAPDGGNPPLIRSLLRGLLFSLSVIYLYCFPLLYLMLSPHRRAFHDYAADTCVVEA
jgi:uncharacterized RDD family membrane protein YckC